MEYVTFGKTGLRASVAGLGCGGFSRLGLATGSSEAEAISLVRAAMDRGVNFFDTARSYNTEDVVGQATQAVPRNDIVLATKGYVHDSERLMTAAEFNANLETSLRALRTDHIDIFQIHAPPLRVLSHVKEMALPELEKAKAAGKIGHIGISGIAADHHHAVLLDLIEDERVEAILVAMHLMHQTALDALLPRAAQRNIGVHIMYAVRNMFARPEVLRKTLADLAEKGEVPAELAAAEKPLDFLLHAGGAQTLTELAYRFARHQPGVHVVLFGTGNPNHLDQNIDAILKPPLPDADLRTIDTLFRNLSGVGLERPPWRVPQNGKPAEIPGGN